MFERVKKVSGKEYRYLVRSIRKGNTVRQEIVDYKGAVKPVYSPRKKAKDEKEVKQPPK